MKKIGKATKSSNYSSSNSRESYKRTEGLLINNLNATKRKKKKVNANHSIIIK